MGGDLGPDVVIEGAVHACRDLGIPCVIVGDSKVINARLNALGASALKSITICHADEVITMEDSPSEVMRGKKNASVRVAFDLVKGGKASAVVSPGNTGAMMAAGIAVSGIIPGILRPAIASLIPRPGNSKPCVLLDSGANVDCKATQLVEFALMGSNYARLLLGSDRPRIALLSNGTESSKGTDILRSASGLLREVKSLNFIGYVEGRDIAKDVADVVVCDGFVGNVALKAMEGTVELVFDSIRSHVENSLRGMLGMWLAKPLLKALFREKLDPSAYGGAPLLGLQSVAVVCHGSSSSRAITNAIKAASKFAKEGLVNNIASAMSQIDGLGAGDYEDGIWNRMGQRFERRTRRSASDNESKD